MQITWYVPAAGAVNVFVTASTAAAEISKTIRSSGEHCELDTDACFACSFHQNFFTDTTSPEVMPSGAIDTDMGLGCQITLDPGQGATITFTVTADQIGEWETACFVGDGAQYDAGMMSHCTRFHVVGSGEQGSQMKPLMVSG